MAWNKHYWNIVEQFYWSPKYLGLNSIPKKSLIHDGNYIMVPVEKVNTKGQIYSRTRHSDAEQCFQWLRTQEEILNHVFNITLSIAPDTLIHRCLLEPLGINDVGPFKYVGREIRSRYGWPLSANIMQNDGLIVGPTSVAGVELKLGAKTYLPQVLKYAAMLRWEELLTGDRAQVGLLYVVPERRVEGFWRQAGFDPKRISRSVLTDDLISSFHPVMRNLITTDRPRYESILDRMTINVVSWEQVRESLAEVASSANVADPGGQTLYRLVSGLVAQIDEHLPPDR